MNKIPRNILIAFIIITLLASISNYSSSGENIDDLAYVMAIAIDVGTTSKYKISLQLSTIESSATEAITKPSEESESGSSGGGKGGSGGGSSEENQSSSNNFEIYTMECSSIDNAINIANTFVNKDITLSHCKVLVISEALAKNGMTNLINTLINKVEIRPDCNIIISSIMAEEFDNSSTPKLENVLSKYYDVTANIETGIAYNQSVELTSFYLALNDPFIQPYASLGKIGNPHKNSYSGKNDKSIDSQAKSLTDTTSKYAVETMGLAVFKGDTMVGTLSGIETMCHLLITNKFDNCIINIPSPLNSNETIDLYIFRVEDTKTKVNIVNSSPFVTSNINVSAKILSTNDNLEVLTQEKLDLIQNATTDYLTDQIYNYYNKTAKDFSSDIAGIGKYAVKNFKTTSQWENYNWLENYKNSTFKVNVEMSIRTGILLTTEE